MHEALKILPGEDYLYFSDGKNAPYGLKTREEVRELFFRAMDFIAEQNVKAIVVACNTATSVGIEDVRKKYGFPIIGMEPAVKPAVEKTGKKRVLVFATVLTLKLEKFKNLVQRIDIEQVVDYLPLQELVAFAENFQFDDAIVLPYLREKLSGIDWERYGVIVLGCTHFPFFREQIRRVVPSHVEILDGNAGTVKNLKYKLGENLSVGSGSVEYYLSGEKMEAAFFEKYLRRLG